MTEALDAAKRIIAIDEGVSDAPEEVDFLDAIAVARALDAQARLIEEAREVVTNAARRFRFYEREHYEKAEMAPANSRARDDRWAKAATNRKAAEECEAFLATLPAKTAESSPTREEMRKVLAAVANAHRLIRGDCPGAAGDVLRDIMQSTSAYQVPATERVDG